MKTITQFSLKTTFILLLTTPFVLAQKIDRRALVDRHQIAVTTIDTLASLSIGNGQFAFTVDATGLQSFPGYYQGGIALGTQASWGWDSFKNPKDYTFDLTNKEYDQYGRKVPYSVQIKSPERQKNAVNWFRENPHRLQLGNLGFEIIKENGQLARPEDIDAIDQRLDLWSGIIYSEFKVEGSLVQVETIAHQNQDVVSFKVTSDLITKDRLQIRFRIPYPSGQWKDTGVRWQADLNYKTTLKKNGKNKALVTHQMDSLTYYVHFQWDDPNTNLSKKQDHDYRIIPENTSFSMSVDFSTNETKKDLPNFKQTRVNSTENWEAFWESGAAVDFSKCSDPRAFELERRVVLSQYLTKIQCTSNEPPQETGLTYNSWYGKPHLEMHWWHGVHFSLWGRSELLKKSMPWYEKAKHKAFKLAERQGFSGLRWQKMTDPFGNESPSSVGSFLIWQQPHYITFAELLYQENPSKDILDQYKDKVFATAEFMASFAHYNKELDRYELGPGVIPAQERFKAIETYNPTYELNYWHWGLKTAIAWKNRLGETPPANWLKVVEKLSDLPVLADIYLATESAQDSYTNAEFKTDHPSVLGTLGMLPLTEKVDLQIMRNTFDLVWEKWSWEQTWGWDFPMTAMTATRLHLPEKAIEALMMDVQTNTYLKNGHNYQDERLTLYLPGNGGLLTAVALMCAGWEENTVENPGFPKDGGWEVQWEGLREMF